VPKPAQESAQKRGVMPVANPTGNPFLALRLPVPKDRETLQKLQVKVDLKKIGDAPRAYRQKIIEAEAD
jgi:hypothetical protein